MIGLTVLAGLVLIGIAFDFFDLEVSLDRFLQENLEDDGSSETEEPTDTIEGSAGSDLLQGTSAKEDILAGAGADTVEAGGGDDVVLGGDGSDIIYGRAGEDSLAGEGGNDEILGGADADVLDGGEGHDTLRGGSGDDVILGYYREIDATSVGQRDDYDPDLLTGWTGDDVFVAGSGDTVIGGDGADTLTLGTWIDPDNPVVFQDYEAGVDGIVILVPSDYSGAGLASVDHYVGGEHSGTVFLDGVRVAEVQSADNTGTLSAAHIIVYPVDDYVA